MDNIEEILIQCIDDIKAGKIELAECLNQHPDLRQELEPLLRMAININEPLTTGPSAQFKISTRVKLMEEIYADQVRKRERKGLWPLAKPYWLAGWSRAVTTVVAVLLVIVISGTGVAYAAQSSLPGDNLYPVKLNTEQLQRVITIDDAAEVDLELKFASTRLDEIEAILGLPTEPVEVVASGFTLNFTRTYLEEMAPDIVSKEEKIALAISGYEKNLNLAITKAEKSSKREMAMEAITLNILDHFNRLDSLEDHMPEFARELLTQTKEIALNSHVRAMQNLAEINPGRAEQLNREVMGNRLNRANTEAANSNGALAGNTQQEYERLQQFGKEITGAAIAGPETPTTDNSDKPADTNQNTTSETPQTPTTQSKGNAGDTAGNNFINTAEPQGQSISPQISLYNNAAEPSITPGQQVSDGSTAESGQTDPGPPSQSNTTDNTGSNTTVTAAPEGTVVVAFPGQGDPDNPIVITVQPAEPPADNSRADQNIGGSGSAPTES